MKRILLSILVIGILLLSACGSATDAPTDTSPKSNEPEMRKPVMIKEWSGTGTKTTESFTISGNQWAISWAFNPIPIYENFYANSFSIQVNKVGESFPIALVANFANVSAGQSDISYIHSSGTFYLDISSLQGSWAIKVFDYK